MEDGVTRARKKDTAALARLLGQLVPTLPAAEEETLAGHMAGLSARKGNALLVYRENGRTVGFVMESSAGTSTRSCPHLCRWRL